MIYYIPFFSMILGAYLLGAVPFGVGIGKYWCKLDIRSLGSGNIGAANAFRVLGPVPGFLVLLLDAAKGAAPVCLAGVWWTGSPKLALIQVIVGLSAIMGHTYSCFLRFKGGKGIATSAGVFLVLSWKGILLSLFVWIVMVLITRFSSLGSLFAAFSLPVFLWLFAAPKEYLVFGILAAIFVFVKHRENIKRLLNRSENKLFCFIIFFLFVMFSITINESFAEVKEPKLTIKGNKRPGGVLFLRLDNIPDAVRIIRISGNWQKTIVPFYKKNNSWNAVLPVARHMKPGIYQFLIYINDDINVAVINNTNINDKSIDGNLNDEKKLTYKIKISSYKFKSQFLSLPKSQVDKYEDPEVEKEYEILDKTLATISKNLIPDFPFKWPVSAEVTTDYGISRFINGEGSGWHKGIDLGAARFTSVKAPQKGKIILARNGFKIHGNTVILDHGHGLLSLYLHLEKILVKEGIQVKKGAVIGTVGSSGIATGPHLHWGTYIYGVPVDPMLLLRIY